MIRTNPKLTPMELYAQISKNLENCKSEGKDFFLSELLKECLEKEKTLLNAK